MTSLLHRTIVVCALCALGGCDRAPEQAVLAFGGGEGSAQPRLTQSADGGVILSWLEPAGRDRRLRYAELTRDGTAQIHDVVTSDRMFVNFADFPSVTQIDERLWFAHWLRRQEGSGAYDVATMISRDGGRNWFPAEQMNEDQSQAEHGFVAVFPWEGGIAAFWLDGRELANWSFDEPDALLATSLRFARYDAAGLVTDRSIVDDMVCDCCQPDVAMTSSGPVVAYRDRTEDEIRDVVVSRFDGARWSGPVNVGDEQWFIEACPVNGPAVAADGDRVAVAWFTAADGQGRVRFARSDDGGASFGPPVEVDGDGAYGQVGVELDGDRVVVSWWRRAAAGGIDLMVREYDRNDRAGAEFRVAHETVGQPIDVPQLIAGDGAYLVAWTTLDDDGTVRIARLTL